MTDEQWVSANLARVSTLISKGLNLNAGCSNCYEKQRESIRKLLIDETIERYKFDRERSTRLVDTLLGMVMPVNSK